MYAAWEGYTYVHEKSENMLREKSINLIIIVVMSWKMSEKQQMIFFSSFFHDYIFIIFSDERKRENLNFERWEWCCSTESVAQFWISQIHIHCAFMRKTHFLSWEKNSLNMKKILFNIQNKNIFFLSHTLLSHFSSSVFMFIFVWMKEKNKLQFNTRLSKKRLVAFIFCNRADMLL